MSGVFEWIASAPVGLFPLMIVVGFWSAAYDAHTSRQMRRYREMKILQVVGFTYLALGGGLWVASKFIH